MAFIGASEILIVLLMGRGIFLPILGLPPGPRDPALARAAPANAGIYFEWVQPVFKTQPLKGSTTPHATSAHGMMGLLHDPEIAHFLNATSKAILKGMSEDFEANDEANPSVIAATQLALGMLGHAGMVFACYEGKPGPLADWDGLHAGLVIQGGNEATDLGIHLLDIAAARVGPFKRNLHRLDVPLPAPFPPLYCHRHQNYIIVALGHGTLDNILQGLMNKTPGFSTNKEFTADWERVKFATPSCMGYLHGPSVITAIAGLTGGEVAKMVTPVVKALGMDALRGIVMCTGLDNGEPRTRAFYQWAKNSSGPLQHLTGRSLRREDLQYIPADADFAQIISFPAAAFLKEMRANMEKHHRDMASGLEIALSFIERNLGMRVGEELLAPLGDVWSMYNSPEGGGIHGSGILVLVETTKPKEAGTVAASLWKRMADSFGPRYVQLRQMEFLGHTIHYLASKEDDMPLAFSYTFDGNRLVMGLHPQTVKAHVRARMEKLPTMADRVGKELIFPKGEVTQIGYTDAAFHAAFLAAVLPYVGSAITHSINSVGNQEMDVFDLPSAKAIIPYMQSESLYSLRFPDGVLVDSQALSISNTLGFASANIGFMSSMFLVRSTVQFKEIAPAAAPVEAKPLPRKDKGPEKPKSVPLKKAN